ncbi:phospholipase D family protein [Ralstonia pseudosolanacearum]|uniref:phospholipase D family protein n=1 Tax=Ralstonia pseudosolanacearum TaxID=1310165 RepID=UPI0018CFF8E7|nr:phospholipase D family protein [Ralstonia pseudosolanacearum]
MKLISTNAELAKQLKRLIEKYPYIAIATAWASADTDAFKSLVRHEGKIAAAVIGTHFYQTHPDVLDQFVGSSRVKFILQPDGVFHPKVYLFWEGDKWEVIIGSPNLTVGALTKNSELSVLITSNDGRHTLKQEIADVIGNHWAQAETLCQAEADSYRKLWKLKKRELCKVADIYGKRPTTKPAVQSKIMSMEWDDYLAEVKKDKTHGFKERLALLKEVRGYFQTYAHFNDMDLDVRKGIAGLPSKGKVIKNWAWFGSMKGALTYSGQINAGNPAYSLALDRIPLVGEVTKKHYDAYIAQYLKAYQNGKDGLATATRLLAMKRPDVFLCVDAKNKTKLAKDVGMTRADQLDYDRYWEEVVVRLKQSPWWQSSEPSDPTESEAWHARAAMLDAIFYEEKAKKK